MTPSTTPATSPNADRVETFLDWFRVNTKLVGVGAAVVVAAGLVYWVIQREGVNKEARAFRQLQVARQSVEQGNLPLATQDLTRLVQSAGDTRSGVQASMLLAQVHFERGEHQKGLEVLDRAAGDADDEGTKAAILALKADGQMAAKQFDQAAASYQQAAEEARFDGQRALFLAARARALTAGGKAQEATQAWTELATNPAYASVAGEARVRLGELTAKAATR